MTVGIVACVEVTTSTSTSTASPTTTPSSSATSEGTVPVPVPNETNAPAATSITTSGTTTLPTSAQTATVCQKVMAQVGGVYVSSVTYSVQPLQPNDDTQLTSNSPTATGVSFPTSSLATEGVLNDKNEPVYTVTVTFTTPQTATSFASIVSGPQSNVNSFSVNYFASSNPNQPIQDVNGTPIVSTSTLVNSQASVVNIPPGLSTVTLSAIRINILSTTPVNE